MAESTTEKTFRWYPFILIALAISSSVFCADLEDEDIEKILLVEHTINSTERNLYGLFPQWDGFEILESIEERPRNKRRIGDKKIKKYKDAKNEVLRLDNSEPEVVDQDGDNYHVRYSTKFAFQNVDEFGLKVKYNKTENVFYGDNTQPETQPQVPIEVVARPGQPAALTFINTNDVDKDRREKIVELEPMSLPVAIQKLDKSHNEKSHRVRRSANGGRLNFPAMFNKPSDDILARRTMGETGEGWKRFLGNIAEAPNMRRMMGGGPPAGDRIYVPHGGNTAGHGGGTQGGYGGRGGHGRGHGHGSFRHAVRQDQSREFGAYGDYVPHGTNSGGHGGGSHGHSGGHGKSYGHGSSFFRSAANGDEPSGDYNQYPGFRHGGHSHAGGGGRGGGHGTGHGRKSRELLECHEMVFQEGMHVADMRGICLVCVRNEDEFGQVLNSVQGCPAIDCEEFELPNPYDKYPFCCPTCKGAREPHNPYDVELAQLADQFKYTFEVQPEDQPDDGSTDKDDGTTDDQVLGGGSPDPNTPTGADATTVPTTLPTDEP